MDIQDLNCFITVCKYMNFTKAGKELHFSQQGVSKIIKQMEISLGVEKALLDGTADIGFCIAPVSSESFTIHRTYRADTYYMISTLNPLSKKDKLSIRDMRGEKFIGFGARNKGHNTLKNYCEAEGFEPVLYAEVDDMNIMYQMVRENRGIGFYVGYPEKSSPIEGIKLVRDVSEGWYWEIILATNKRHELRAIDKAFIKEFYSWH